MRVSPVSEVAHEDPGDGEDDDEGGPRQHLVLPALATVGPDTARLGLTLRLVLSGRARTETRPECPVVEQDWVVNVLTLPFASQCNDYKL